MQNHRIFSIPRIDHDDNMNRAMRNYYPEEPVQYNKMIKCSAVVLLIIALILVITLVVGSALIFTIGLKSTEPNSKIESSSSSSSTNLLYEPCLCGCPSIEPLFNNEKTATARIINGETARAHSWPWQVLLLVIGENQQPFSYCGATLLTDRHILTAAHCVHRHVPPFIFVFPGQHIFNLSISLTLGYPVDKIYIHESYNVLLHHDIAIITIRQPLRFDSNIRPICLATPNSSILLDNEELVAVGWGRISAEPETLIYAQTLQQVKLSYVSSSHPNCSKIFQPMTNVHPGQMCAGKPGYNACQGDSGGPLMRRVRIPNSESYYWQQVGIASKTIDCGWNSTWPDIYINIPYYYDWIIATVKRAG